MTKIKLPTKYLPSLKEIKDSAKQVKMLMKSRKQYKKGKFFTRKKIKSYKSKTSNHITDARKIYGIENIAPNKELSRKTGCSLSALKQIVRKGQGAYYSSGSRPNQTSQSWGLARLASSIFWKKVVTIRKRRFFWRKNQRKNTNLVIQKQKRR
jgi:hypothetical protein